jgi:hypothetical protein
MANPGKQSFMDCFYFSLHPYVALRVTLIPNNANRRLVDKVYFSPKLAGNANCLRGASGVRIN